MKTISLILSILFAFPLYVFSQHYSWHEIKKNADKDWLNSHQASDIVDSLLCYQLENGGWPKNQDWVNGANQEEMASCRTTGIGSTIDNGATYEELEFLARYYAANKDSNQSKLKTVFQAYVKGVEYLLNAQYDNGGWPQFFPVKKASRGLHYCVHITFNDCAMSNVLRFFYKILEKKKEYGIILLPEEMMKRVGISFQKGIDCILACQIVKDGKKTVWCQQHDEVTLRPAPARAFELASFSGANETPDILMLLMSLKNPSESVVESVKSAIEWLEQHAIHDMELELFTNVDGKSDRRLVEKKGAKTLWARYYDLETEKPFYCDRDGIAKSTLEAIGYERRNGYSWVNDSPQRAIDYYYHKWKYKPE